MILEAIDIHKSFGETEILKGISMELQKSEVVSIVGPSGAGKTTLLNVLSTLSKPTSGKVLFEGKDVSEIGRKSLQKFRCKNVGFVFQSHNLLSEFSALENVSIAAIIAGQNKNDAESQAKQLLVQLGLEKRLNSKPSTLSGGEAQRVAVARALINRPLVVFADEPSGNLDSTGREELHSLFFELRERLGQTFLIVTHDDSLAKRCDRTIEIRDGLLCKN